MFLFCLRKTYWAGPVNLEIWFILEIPCGKSVQKFHWTLKVLTIFWRKSWKEVERVVSSSKSFPLGTLKSPFITWWTTEMSMYDVMNFTVSVQIYQMFDAHFFSHGKTGDFFLVFFSSCDWRRSRGTFMCHSTGHVSAVPDEEKGRGQLCVGGADQTARWLHARAHQQLQGVLRVKKKWKKNNQIKSTQCRSRVQTTLLRKKSFPHLNRPKKGRNCCQTVRESTPTLLDFTVGCNPPPQNYNAVMALH